MLKCPFNFSVLLLLITTTLVSCGNNELNTNIEKHFELSDNEFISDDMILLRGEKKSDLSSSSYSGFRYYETRPWPNGLLPIEFDRKISSARRNRFLNLCNDVWGANADIQCVPWSEARHGDLKIYLTQDNSGCWSHVGAAPSHLSQTRRMNLSSFGCWSNRVILHELGHALGLLHEHQRPDRDQFVKIFSENAHEKYKYAFQLLVPKSSNTIQVASAYDFKSIMHYNSQAFSKNGRKTITALPEYRQYENSFGRLNNLSPTDHNTLKHIYGSK